MTLRPSFQFYPGDWRKNANLRRCSPAARGVWLDVMCVLHEQEQYGLARWPLTDIAKAATASMAHLRELVEKNVLKGIDKGVCTALVYVPRSGRRNGDPVILVPAQDGPIWFSSRMVRDEYVRTIRAESSGSGASPKDAPKPPKGETNGAPKGPRGSSSSSSPTGNSDADASGGEPPELPCDPPDDPPQQTAPPPPLPSHKDIVFALGVPMLTGAGVAEKNARSFLAMQCKQHGDADVAEALRQCAQQHAIEPVPWIQNFLGAPKRAGGKHTGFASKNYREGVEEDGTFA